MSPAPRLVCLGQFTVDDIYLPDGTYVPNSTGGDALYAALGAQVWEPNVEIVAPVGHDLPESTLHTLESADLNVEGLAQREGVLTIHNEVYYDIEGRRRWELLTPVADFSILSPRPEDIPTHYLEAEVFLISAMALEAQELLVPWLRQHTNGLVALDTQEDYVAGNELRLRDLISSVDLFLPSAAEAAQLVGHQDWVTAAQEFSNTGPKVVVIKLGAEGTLVYDREMDASFRQPATPIEIVDETGAGDAFCGGFLAGYLQEGADVKRAARAGAISASYAIASFGVDALLAADEQEAQMRLEQTEIGT